MSYLYCTSCGEKNVYTGKAPKFCNYCGSKIGSKNEKNTFVNKSIQAHEEESDETSTDINVLPSLSSLQYEISSSQKKTFKFEEIVREEAVKQEEG
jgi:hypothetical protein